MTDRSEALLSELVELHRRQIANQERAIERQEHAIAVQAQAVARQRRALGTVWVLIVVLAIGLLYPVISFMSRVRP